MIKFGCWDCRIKQAEYDNGRRALMLIDAVDGSPIAKATVNIPEQPLAKNEVFIKGWSENEGMQAVLIKAGVIGPEKRRVPTGFAEATVHECLL